MGGKCGRRTAPRDEYSEDIRFDGDNHVQVTSIYF